MQMAAKKTEVFFCRSYLKKKFVKKVCLRKMRTDRHFKG